MEETKQKTLKVITVSGKEITVDVTDETCLKFGFRHKDRIITPEGNKGTIIGVGPSCACILCQAGGTAGKDTLHFALDMQDGKVCHWGIDNLRNQGFKLESEN